MGDGGVGAEGGEKGDVLIVDGSGADSCNDLICLCAWRWKDRTPPERIAPSFSVNRVNYLYNEICKVVNFRSSLFLPSQLFTPLRTFSGPQLISPIFFALPERSPPPTPTPFYPTVTIGVCGGEGWGRGGVSCSYYIN